MSLVAIAMSGVPASAADAPYWQLKNIAQADTPTSNVSTRLVKVMSIRISLLTAVATSVGLIFSLAPGTETAAATKRPVSLNPGALPNSPLGPDRVHAVSAWAVAPTKAVLPADQFYLGKATLPAVIGAQYTWDFFDMPSPGVPGILPSDGPGLWLPGSVTPAIDNSLLLWNFGALAGASINVEMIADVNFT